MSIRNVGALTISNLIEAVITVAKNDPDFKYRETGADGAGTKCEYPRRDPSGELFHDHGRGCIIGEAFLMTDPYKVYASRDTIQERLESGDLSCLNPSEQEVSWLTTVQERQDVGMSWSASVDYADNDCGRPAAR